MGNREMLFVLTSKGMADPSGQLIRGEETIGLSDAPFTVDPHRLNGVEPRTLDRKIARHDSYTSASRSYLSVAPLNPVTYLVAYMPAGVVPHQKQSLLTKRLKFCASPFQKGCGHATDWLAIHKAQPHFLPNLSFGCDPTHQQSVACQRLGVTVIFGDRLLNQTQRTFGISPGVQAGSCQAAPPDFVLKTQSPLRVSCGQSNQPVPVSFFLAYSGSGLVIHCLALRQRIPSRAKVARIVSPLTRWAVNPCSKLTSAAKPNVHRLVGLSKLLGLWCRRARNCSALSPSKAL